MIKYLLCSAILYTGISCKSKNGTLDENLPKDIALKKTLNDDYKPDSIALSLAKSEITDLLSAVPCSDATKWKIAPMGEKACGGPASYIAYPKEMEEEILPKIQRYSVGESAFNERYGIVSDCKVEPVPLSVRCENGKAVFEENLRK